MHTRHQFDFNRFLDTLERRSIRLGVTLLFLAWIAAHVTEQLSVLKFPSFFLGEQKAKVVHSPHMGLKACRVTVTDMEGIEHTTEVSASTLYEAVAMGLHTIRGSEWSGEIPEGMNTVRVSVQNVPVEHTVKIGAFKQWLSREGGSPADKMARAKLREILQ